MSMYRYDRAGYSGQSYDRNVFDANLSTVNKLQRDFWTAKQVLRKKFGKQDDDCIVASDSELDAKLDLFECINMTCTDLIKLIEKYQQCICALSRDENAMGRFLKDQGSLDKTPAGKLMGAMGKAQCNTSQQRLNMRNSLARLHHDVETFRYRAIGDSLLSINNMEEARTHYRASLRWMQDISANLDPEQYKKLEKFRKVQTEVRLNKEKFDRMKWGVCQKVDLLCASRTNLFSATLVPYQTELGKFWEKSSHCLAAVLENIKDHKHYEFKLLKDLNPLTDGNEAYAKAEPPQPKRLQQAGSKNIKDDDDDELINLGDFGSSSKKLGKSADGGGGGSDSTNEMNTQDNDCDLLGADDFNLKETHNSNADEDDDDLLLNDLLGNEGSGEFEKQWESVFGEFKQAPDADKKTSMSLENLLITDEGDSSSKTTNNKTTSGPSGSKSTSVTNAVRQQVDDSTGSGGGYLPSQLLDLMAMDDGGQVDSLHQQQNFLAGSYDGQGTPSMFTNLNPSLNNEGGGGSYFGGMQPPSYGASQLTQLQQTGNTSNQQHKSGGQPTTGKTNSSRAAWYDLFAELDPLQNPDALGKMKEDEKNKDGGAC